LRDEQEPREIASAVDELRTMLETIQETRGDDECYVYSGLFGTSRDNMYNSHELKVDHRLHVIHYGLMVQGMIHVVIDMH
jgi:hypothetical protein